jgi:hypothetical protein
MLNKLLVSVVFLLGLSTGSATGLACSSTQSEPFDGFFQRFSSDRTFALERTVLPLQMWQWEYGVDANGKDDSAPKKSLLARNDYLKWPVLKEHMTQNGLQSKVKSRKKTATVVEVFKPDTDWLVSWHFRAQSGCWYFWRHEDHSL